MYCASVVPNLARSIILGCQGLHRDGHLVKNKAAAAFKCVPYVYQTYVFLCFILKYVLLNISSFTCKKMFINHAIHTRKPDCFLSVEASDRIISHQFSRDLLYSVTTL